MPKMDKDGREYIEQDGKRYYRNFWGEWEAEKDWFGNDKVETDWLGNPKIESDWLGNQIIETDFFGNPYVEPEKKDDSGCYLTTACIRAKGDEFDDNCEELAILRKFRDTYVKENYPAEIEHYYQIAPKVVKAISKQDNSKDIYEKMYEDLVKGTIELILSRKYEDAYLLYKRYGEKLIEEYGTQVST